ncbi:MAG: excinuclease ABC subunit UvrC [Candidatus Aminicenantes bacterium]|nr:MAG: excinuclease ABC subunit UvrC [Candidatus Aminicenantes bacterium]
MKDRLRKKAQSLPQKAGIYFFKTQTGEVIYIGKARSLRNRVKSYFQQTSDAKIKKILSETWDVDFILTDSTKEAAFLENNFIRQHQPKYNLRLKDDKSFPYLKMTLREGFPALTLTRRVEEDGAKYYGPYSPAHRARQTSHLITKYFGVRTCQEAVPGKRKRPCLDYDLKLCSAPCVSYISEQDYRESVENARLFLEGKTEKLLSALKKKMRAAATRQEFEQAAHWRDLIHTIEEIKQRPKLISVRKEDIDIFGFIRENEYVAVYVFYMRAGRVIESEELYFPEKEETKVTEVLYSCLMNFYTNREDIPDKILLPFSPERKEKLSKMLSKKRRKKIEITIPLKGKYKKLVDLARTNAEILMRKKSEALSPLEEAKKIFELKALPVRIEGYDISNTGGDESVGSLVVFENGLPQKNDYRKYKIKSVEGPNDVASLQEVIRRRYTRLLQEKAAFPDLILVDGGKGQLNAARTVLKELGLGHLPVVSLAKKEEIIFTPAHKNGIRLDKTSPVLMLFQSIRDESHRFALSFHRMRRSKKSFASRLDGITGIGQKRKNALLAEYNGIEEIEKASIEELSAIIGRKAAQSLVDKLKAE